MHYLSFTPSINPNRSQTLTRCGSLTPQLRERIEALSTHQLEDLGEALLDFTGVADLEAWLKDK